ncbi:MAG: hypothetical protein K2I93_01070, partial [Oscillospiraceae bacterium]|nr:hypothetical protein [Oscillospiraceae bacterium]
FCSAQNLAGFISHFLLRTQKFTGFDIDNPFPACYNIYTRCKFTLHRETDSVWDTHDSERTVV